MSAPTLPGQPDAQVQPHLPAQSDASERYCPICGRRTPLPYCPAEGTHTVEMRGFGRNPRAFQAGDIVGDRYQISGPLGTGGFAAVFAAQHLGTQQELAIKLMAAEPGQAGEVAMRRFFREAKVTASLQHPNTVRVFDVGQDSQGPLYMAMELIRGRTLHAELRERIVAKMLFSQAEVIDLALQVLDSLAEAHQHQLVHRDLKPANLMLVDGADGHRLVKVLDFGIARTVDSSLTATGAAPGTPAFMSPEQCKGDEVDGRSDLYSLAVLMFACVVGRLPFEHKEPLRLMQMHVMAPAPDPRTLCTTPLTDAFVQVLLRTLAKKPGERYATAAAMRAALQAVAEGRDLPDDLSAAPDLVGAGEETKEWKVAPVARVAAAAPLAAEPQVVAAPVAVALPADSPVAAPVGAGPAGTAGTARGKAVQLGVALGAFAVVAAIAVLAGRGEAPAPAVQAAPAAAPVAAPAAVPDPAPAVAAPVAEPAPAVQPVVAPAAVTAEAAPAPAPPAAPHAGPAKRPAVRAKENRPGLAPQLVD